MEVSPRFIRLLLLILLLFGLGMMARGIKMDCFRREVRMLGRRRYCRDDDDCHYYCSREMKTQRNCVLVEHICSQRTQRKCSCKFCPYPSNNQRATRPYCLWKYPFDYNRPKDIL